jgi:release factor glutamine methyltransferase
MDFASGRGLRLAPALGWPKPSGMTVSQVIQRSTEFLARHGVESARLHAELMLAHVLQMPRLQLYLNFDRVLTDTELDALRAMVKRRSAREPLQHILGLTNFCGLDLEVNRDVLVPRPETELLAERACSVLAGMAGANPVVLDFGTGSGCLAVVIATRFPVAQVHATDVSEPALTVARRNAARHGVAERIQFHRADGLATLPPELRFDLLVSNPPYIPTAQIASLQPEVRDHDPHVALDGGPDGLRFFRLLAAEAPAFLKPGAVAVLEFGDGQAAAVQALFQAHGWQIMAVEPDEAGTPRLLVARRA